MGNELVNHPAHYKQEDRDECIIEIEDKYGKRVLADFCLTNAYKYLYRAGLKEGNSAKQDKDKAKWYYDYLMNRGWFNSRDMYIDDHLTDLYLDIKHRLVDTQPVSKDIWVEKLIKIKEI